MGRSAWINCGYCFNFNLLKLDDTFLIPFENYPEYLISGYVHHYALSLKEWSEGIEKGKDNKHMAEFLGLARSAEFEITANSEKYLSEVKSLIGKLQKDIVAGIKAEL